MPQEEEEGCYENKKTKNRVAYGRSLKYIAYSVLVVVEVMVLMMMLRFECF